MRRVICAILFMAVAAAGTSAAGGENATPPPGENKGSPSGSPSYFEGVWVGAWPAWQDASTSQDVTVKIERGVKEGFFRVEYSWGSLNLRSGIVPPGSLRARGRAEDDRLVFRWKNKAGNDVEITLRKHEDNKVKARIEKFGPLNPAERPFTETILTRK